MAASVDENVQSIALYNPVHVALHGYIAPFLVLYPSWFYLWVFVYGTDDYYESGLIILAAICIVQILVCLSCYWSVHVRCALTCTKVSSRVDSVCFSTRSGYVLHGFESIGYLVLRVRVHG